MVWQEGVNSMSTQHIAKTQPQKKEISTSPFGLTDVLLITVALIWGLNLVLVKVSLAELGPLPYNALRFTLAATLASVALRILEPNSRLERRDIPIFIGLGFLAHTLYQFLFIQGINLTTAGNAAILMGTSPMWVSLLSALTGTEQLHRRNWLGLLLSFSGILLVTIGSGKEIGFAAATSRGDLLILTGSLVWAVYTLISKPLLTRYSPLQLLTYTIVPGAIGLVALAFPALRQQDLSSVSVAAWAGLAYSGILAIVVGYIIWNTGVQKLGASRTALYNNLSPLMAMLCGWLMLAEKVATLQVGGAALIIFGLYVARNGNKRNKEISH